ncbi:MAG: hypothetical protein EMLJLAPB_00325 [Candidatus Argoarchaeum ethanivorans]|uniref:DUF3344 domain-containing protein n=1 Tax=Candidatus Argoarchaeum ethanivorans TaxID=2608793 RepID=A0A811TAC9_9EURY|nr:MAG: hypothetical protein EMLJLAPB_00325 [Candidatus Argoarchaeum ethanivorans]
MNKTIIIALLSVIMVCLLAVPAMANYSFDGWDVTTRTNGTINGSVFTDSVAWNGQTTLTLSTDVPNGTVKAAYLYTGVWGGNPSNAGWHNVTFNDNCTANGLGPIHLEGNKPDGNPNVWCTGYGKYWWWYNVTNLTNAGETNTATTSKINGSLDGRVYGTVLVVVLENTSEPRIQYWINDGSDALNYETPINDGTTYFNGSVDNASVTKSALTVVHLTGYSPTCSNCLDFNDHPLDTSMVDSNTIEVNTWDETNNNVKPENVTSSGNHADYRRGEDPLVNICNAILVLQKEAAEKPDLTVTDIEFPDVIRPDKDATINATITNQGSACGAFNVSLYVDDVPNGTTVNVTNGLSASSSIDVNFTVNLSEGCYTFKVVADSGGVITESNEGNNESSENYQVGYVIIVKSNSDFEKLNTSGDYALPDDCFKNVSGTYYIQNLTIENCAGKGISIENTDATFVINNCTVKNCADSGIYFHDLSYGTVNGSTVQNNTKYGIEVGLVPLGSDDPEFVNITNNTIEENLYGVELICSNCTVDKNTILNNTDYGVYLLANDTSVTDNIITNSSDYGVKLYNSARNYVYCNTFTDNNAGNPGLQAWDNGTTNYWNTTDAGKNYTGNRWSDWKDNSGFPSNYTIDDGSNADERPKGLYDFLTGAGTDKWAFRPQINQAEFDSGSPIYPSTVLSTEPVDQYVNITVDDGTFLLDNSGNDGYYAAHRFNFSITEGPSDIAKINVTWNGIGYHEQVTDGAVLYIWNFSSTGYEQLADSGNTDAEVTLTGEATTSISSYINAGIVTVLVKQKSAHTTPGNNIRMSWIKTDYVKLVVAP